MTLHEITDHKSACAYIDEASRLGSRPGLSRIRELCDLLGNPEKKIPVIHIAGTNGKGSTAAMISSGLSLAGIKNGMYYSPALCGLTDHYMINGKIIPDEVYDDAVKTVAAANEQLKEKGDGATQFELETAVAFVCFLKKKCDVIVMECGMGGRDDATNIAGSKACCVITSISRDHMQYLGDTVAQIAAVKAGIITSDCPVIAFDSSKEATDEIKKRCKLTGSRLHIIESSRISIRPGTKSLVMDYEEFSNVSVGLKGTFQAANAAVALRTLSVLRDEKRIPDFCPDDETLTAGIKNAKWPFRFEKICDDPPVYVDGAHNEDAAKKLCESVGGYLPGIRIVLVAGMFADKEYEKVSKILSDTADCVYTVETPDNPRALPAKELAACMKKFAEDVTACDSIAGAAALSVKRAESIRRLTGTPAAVLACGSLSYLSDFKDAVKKCKELTE